MQNDNHNKEASWRSRIDEEESAYDKNAGWEKLHKKLNSKKNDRKRNWYWLAAAVLLAAVVAPFFFVQNKNNVVSQNVIKQSVKPQPELPNASPVKEDKPVSINVVKSQNKMEKAISKNNEQGKTNITEIENEIRLPDTVSNSLSSGTVSAVQPVKPDTVVKVTALTHTKKILPVVHINELNGKSDLPAAGERTAMHTFQLKFGSGETFANPASVGSSKDAPLFKIKTSPN